jgi:TetR/AcrR family tetracycline transcriptional repressor
MASDGPSEPFLPWAQYEKPARTRQPLNRDTIVNAALKVVDEQGMAALSMRAVAQALGTGPASLYAHVASKEQLVDLVLDQVYGDVELPDPDPDRWQDQVREFAWSVQRVALAHPGIAAAMLSGPPMGPNGLRMMEAGIALLRAGGLPDTMASYAGELLGQYIAVTALEQETFRARFGSDGQEKVNEWVGQFHEYLESLPAGQFPNLVAMTRSGQFMRPSSDEERFNLGLDIIIAGLAAYAGRA